MKNKTCVEFDVSEKHLSDFMRMTSYLYSRKKDAFDRGELKELLLGTHILSKYFTLRKFCIYCDEKIVGRFVLTFYSGDDTAYLGFVEGIEEEEVWNFLFERAEFYAKQSGCQRIIGPVDASFWIRYRLKIDFFEEEPYTGEPYHREYYLNMFLKNGYHIIQKCSSSFYGRVREDYQNVKLKKRYQQFNENGYKIVSPEADDINMILKDIYHAVSRLYRNFPVYKEVSLEDFCEYMKRYFKIINLNMVKIAYHEEKMVGFCIAIPDYRTAVYHVNKILNLCKVLYYKKFPKKYILLYMGVDKEHKGLGSALSYVIYEELKKIRCESIGALILEGKVTQGYAGDLIKKRYNYVLLGKDL